jgi:hypothetical protein
LGAANTLPVGSAIGGPGKTALLDKAFDQHRTVAVALAEIRAQTTEAQGQDLRSKMGAVNPGEDEEAAVVEDLMQTGFALGMIPANESIPVADLPCGGTEAKGSQPTSVPSDEIADLGTGHRRKAQVVPSLDEPIVECGEGVIPDREHAQAWKLVDPTMKGILRGPIDSGRSESAAIAIAIARSGQIDESTAMKAQEGHAGTHEGEGTAGGRPVHVLTDATGKLRAG